MTDSFASSCVRFHCVGRLATRFRLLPTAGPEAFSCPAAKNKGIGCFLAAAPPKPLNWWFLFWYILRFDLIQVEDALLARDQARALEIQSRRELARVLEARKVRKRPRFSQAGVVATMTIPSWLGAILYTSHSIAVDLGGGGGGGG